MKSIAVSNVNKKMQAVKSTGSKIETALGKALWKNGHRYRKNDRRVFGNPDFTFKTLRIAIFVDSEFWHGKNWKVRKHDHKTNKRFWHRKIEKNIARDKLVNRTLARSGWNVLRFWGQDIQTDIENCVRKIERVKHLSENKRYHRSIRA